MESRTKARTKRTGVAFGESPLREKHLKWAIKLARDNARRAETPVERQRWLDTAEQLLAGTYIVSLENLRDDAG